MTRLRNNLTDRPQTRRVNQLNGERVLSLPVSSCRLQSVHFLLSQFWLAIKSEFKFEEIRRRREEVEANDDDDEQAFKARPRRRRRSRVKFYSILLATNTDISKLDCNATIKQAKVSLANERASEKSGAICARRTAKLIKRTRSQIER